MSRHYLAGNVVIAISGSFSDENIAYIKDRFSEMKPGAESEPKAAGYQPALR
jgi:predicted Zn-dependent peptidase